jgi:hypothetical protein
MLGITEDVGIVVLGSSVNNNRRNVVDHGGDMPNETHPRSGCVVMTCGHDVDQYKHIKETYSIDDNGSSSDSLHLSPNLPVSRASASNPSIKTGDTR